MVKLKKLNYSVSFYWLLKKTECLLDKKLAREPMARVEDHFNPC
jgi:hypothetical protein